MIYINICVKKTRISPAMATIICLVLNRADAQLDHPDLFRDSLEQNRNEFFLIH